MAPAALPAGIYCGPAALPAGICIRQRTEPLPHMLLQIQLLIHIIGLMGETSCPRNVLNFLAALENCLAAQKFPMQAGASIAAANDVYQ